MEENCDTAETKAGWGGLLEKKYHAVQLSDSELAHYV